MFNALVFNYDKVGQLCQTLFTLFFDSCHNLVQNDANTSWACTIVNYLAERLFAAWAVAVERRLNKVNPQIVANTAWAFATLTKIMTANEQALRRIPLIY